MSMALSSAEQRALVTQIEALSQLTDMGFKSVSHRLDILNGTVASHQKDIQLIRDTMVKEVDYATDRTNDRTERRDTRTDNTQAWRVFVAPIVSGLALALALKVMGMLAVKPLP